MSLLPIRYYTGIGARITPEPILQEMTRTAQFLVKRSWVLRSGGAVGADQAFEKGADGWLMARVPGKEIFWAHHANAASDELAKRYLDPELKWDRLKEHTQKLFSRNMFQVLGWNLNSPSEFVVAWTPDGKDVGGTRIALRCARDHNVPVYNLALEPDRTKLRELFISLK